MDNMVDQTHIHRLVLGSIAKSKARSPARGWPPSVRLPAHGTEAPLPSWGSSKGGSGSQQPQNESWRDQLCDIYRNVTCEQLIFLRCNWLENDWKPDFSTETRKREAFCPPVFHPGLWRMLARTQAWCQVLSGWEPDPLQQAPCGYGHASWRGTRRIVKECVNQALKCIKSWPKLNSIKTIEIDDWACHIFFSTVRMLPHCYAHSPTFTP